MPFTFHDRPAVQVVIRDITRAQAGGDAAGGPLPHRGDHARPWRTCRRSTRTIHGIVGELMYARNFYLALQDEATGAPDLPVLRGRGGRPEPPAVKQGKTLTEYVLRTGEPLLASPAVFERPGGQGRGRAGGRALRGLAGRAPQARRPAPSA